MDYEDNFGGSYVSVQSGSSVHSFESLSPHKLY